MEYPQPVRIVSIGYVMEITRALDYWMFYLIVLKVCVLTDSAAFFVALMVKWQDLFPFQVQVFGLYSGEEFHETFDCPIKVGIQ